MFVHSVYFWLKPDLGESEVGQMEAGLDSLTRISPVRQHFIGKPAGTDRPVIDRSYSYGLVLVFDDKNGHDEYQEHEVHERFRQECSPLWHKVVIYDFAE